MEKMRCLWKWLFVFRNALFLRDLQRKLPETIYHRQILAGYIIFNALKSLFSLEMILAYRFLRLNDRFPILKLLPDKHRAQSTRLRVQKFFRDLST